MTYETITYETDENVAEVTLNQPDKHNPLNDQSTAELVDVFETILETDDVHAVLLTGAGDTFSAGGDIEEFSERLDQRATHIFSEGETSARLFQLLTEYEKPIIGAINGHAFGGGCGLAAACHLTYAASDAKLGTTEVNLGIFPLTILPVLRARIGDQNTLEMALTGERMTAERAAKIDLITDVVSDGEAAVQRARETAREIANKSPLAVSLGLHAFHQTTDMTHRKAIDALNAYRVLFFKSHDLNEGATAFLEDRDPEWQGY